MEAIVERIVEKCIQSELIEESQRDWMAYSLQRKFMNFGGFFILVCFGTLVAPLPQVILLNFGLALLREKTNGLHMPTVFSCFITSLFCEYTCLYLIDRLQSSTIAAAITLFIVSAMLILILAPCNNSAMHCSNEELRDMKIAVRKRLVLYCLIIPALLLLKPLYSIVWIVAAAADALLLHNLTRIHAQGYIEETVYQERRIRIEQQLAEKKKYLTCQKQNGTAEKALYQTKQIDRYMQNHTALTEFDEEAMRTIVKKIVVSNEAFVFELPNGLHLKEKR